MQRTVRVRAMILDSIPQLSKNRKIVLASASPRRQELLRQIGLKYEVIVSNFEENLDKTSVSGSEYAKLTATHKALDVAHHHLTGEVDLIISADTVVECDQHILEKPIDAADAKRMLQLLNGRGHQVHTGVALVTKDLEDWHVHSFVETTQVVFDQIADSEIDAYINSGEPFGKAGSYGIQGMAAPFVSSIHGCYFNVVGLPLHRLTKEMKKLLDSGKLTLL